MDPAIHTLAIVRSEAAPQSQVVGAVHHVDRVQLQRAGALEVLRYGTLVELRGATWSREALPVEPEPHDLIQAEGWDRHATNGDLLSFPSQSGVTTYRLSQ